jgi:hypothetical protein
MSKVKIQGDPLGGGTITVAAPNTNSDRVLTLPDTTATLLTNAGGTLTGGLTLGGQLNLGSTGQIVFPATQNASANANTLDDYEEGTWSSAVSASGGATVIELIDGTYTKIGRLVTLFASINFSGASGALVISNIPFITATNNFPLGIGREDASSGYLIYFRTSAGNVNVGGWYAGATGNASAFQVASGNFRIQLSYFTS